MSENTTDTEYEDTEQEDTVHEDTGHGDTEHEGTEPEDTEYEDTEYEHGQPGESEICFTSVRRREWTEQVRTTQR